MSPRKIDSQVAAALVVDADLFVGISSCDVHVKSSKQAVVVVDIELCYAQAVNRVFWEFWSENKVYDPSKDGYDEYLKYDEGQSPTQALLAAVSLWWF